MLTQESISRVPSDDYKIHLNFLSVEMKSARCVVFRRPRASAQEDRPSPQATAQRLPSVERSSGDWNSFWILTEPADGFEPFDYDPAWSPDLSRRILYDALKRSVLSSRRPDAYRFPVNPFIQEASLIMTKHAEGDELLVVQPYFLKASQKLGFLVDFHFSLRDGVPFSRKVQQLSLSLDKSFRRNVDYYVDRSSRVRRFVDSAWGVFEGLTFPGASEPLRISKDFESLPADRLRPKVYVFAGAKESRSQFTGLREFGPLQPLSRPPRLLFAFREQDRQAARRLAVSLKGQKQRSQFNFPGFSELFKTGLEIDANPIVLPDLSPASMEAALHRATSAREGSQQVLPVIVLPNGEDNVM